MVDISVYAQSTIYGGRIVYTFIATNNLEYRQVLITVCSLGMYFSRFTPVNHYLGYFDGKGVIWATDGAQVIQDGAHLGQVEQWL